jgi:cysteine sulfinate desulfinase/cysteine desulfurase-like protein
MKDLKKAGVDFAIISVDHEGILNRSAMEGMITKETVLTSVMLRQQHDWDRGSH